MATLTNTKIKDTYDGLLKTTNNEAIGASGVTLIEDGLGNASALSVGRANNGVTITGNLAVDTNTLYVDAANNWVGIGKTSRLDTQTKFQISSGDSGVTSFSSFGDDVIIEHSTNVGLTFATPNDGFASILFADPEVSGAGSILYDHSGDNLRISTNNAERMRIDSSGRVFIGTTSAFDANAITMSDNGQVFANNFAIANAAGSVGGTSPNLYSPASATLAISTGGSERMRIDSDGNVIIKEKAGAFTPATNGLSLSTGYGVSYLFSKSSGGTEADMYYNAANQIFNTGGSERMRILSSGGITFNGDTAAANALDDYEEGTFTPEFRDESGALTVTYDVQTGTYTKIGNVVTFTISLGTDSVTIPTPSDQLRINLPFTVRSGHSQGFSLGYNYNFATALEPYPTGISASDRLIFYSANSVNASPVSSLNTGTNSNRLIITGTYLT